MLVHTPDPLMVSVGPMVLHPVRIRPKALATMLDHNLIEFIHHWRITPKIRRHADRMRADHITNRQSSIGLLQDSKNLALGKTRIFDANPPLAQYCQTTEKSAQGLSQSRKGLQVQNKMRLCSWPPSPQF